MTRFALKALLGRKLRTVLSAFAIVLGVATVSGTYVLTDSIDSQAQVSLMTLHNAKGREYQAVAIIDLHEGRIPFYQAETAAEFEEAKRLRQQPALQNAVLVAMTGYGRESDRKRSREAGFDHHLVKPGDFGKVLQ